jgi:hypothetical protein
MPELCNIPCILIIYLVEATLSRQRSASQGYEGTIMFSRSVVQQVSLLHVQLARMA